MTKELEKKLEESFSFMKKEKTFAQQMEANCIDELYGAFGVQCQDGWYDLIYNLCTEIVNIYSAEGRPTDLVVDQIKEKYGTLRFYYHFKGKPKSFHAFDFIGKNSTSIRMMPKDSSFEEKIALIVEKYEEQSGHICEECGSTGELRPNLGWIMTLCDDCYERKVSGIKDYENIHNKRSTITTELMRAVIINRLATIAELKRDNPQSINDKVKELRQRLIAARNETRIYQDEQHFEEWAALVSDVDKELQVNTE